MATPISTTERHHQFKIEVLEKNFQNFDNEYKLKINEELKEMEFLQKDLEIQREKIMKYYEHENRNLIENVLYSINCSKPFRNKILGVFKKRDLEDFIPSQNAMKVGPLNEHFQVTLWKNLKKFPESQVRDYFGEKIALYLSDLNAYRDWLIPSVVYGAIHFTFEQFYNSNNKYNQDEGFVERIYEVSSIVFCCFLTLWNTYFLVKQDIYHQQFDLKYDQSEDKETRLTKTNRFKGVMMRNIESDNINNRMENSKVLFWRNLVSKLLLTFILALTCLSAYVVLMMKRKSYREGWLDYRITNQFKVSQVVFDVVEFFRNLIFEMVFFRVIKYIVRWCEFKYMHSHERKLIIYLSIYQLVNNAFAAIYVSFEILGGVKQRVVSEDGVISYANINENCIGSSCDVEVINLIATYWVLKIIWRIAYQVIFVKIFRVTKKIKKIWKKKEKITIKKTPNIVIQTIPYQDGEDAALKDRFYKEGENYLGMTSGESHEVEIRKQNDVRNAVYLHYADSDHYKKIDKEINTQVSYLEDSDEKDDNNIMLMANLKLGGLYTYGLLFGIYFTFSFSVCWICSLLDLYLIRDHLLYNSKRPKCDGSRSSGLWLSLMKFNTYLSICTNSYYISFHLFIDKQTYVQFVTFVVMMISLSLVNQIFEYYLIKLMYKVEILKLRQNFIQGLVFENKKNKDKTVGLNRNTGLKPSSKSEIRIRETHEEIEGNSEFKQHVSEIHNQMVKKDDLRKELQALNAQANMDFLNLFQE